MLQDRFISVLVAVWAYEMRWFGRLSVRLSTVGHRSPTKFVHFVALLLSVPCFKASHFFFKLAYAANQRRLLRLGRKDLFLQFYDGRISDGRIVHVLEGLRAIKHRIEGLQTCQKFSSYHREAP